jgi:hypothetical protein
MAAEEQHAREGRLRPSYAAVAGIGALGLLGAAAMQFSGPQSVVSELTISLITISRRSGLEIGSAVVNGIGLVAVGFTLAFLAQASRARRPEITSLPRWTALAGAGLAAALGIVSTAIFVSKAHQFAAPGSPQTYVQANALVGTGVFKVLQYLNVAAISLLALGFVLVSLNAMRVGLVTKFGGYLGMAAGAASVFFFGTPPALLIEVFWLGMIAFLLSGRWGSEPEAWRAGKAIPWPSSAELREQRQRAGGARGGRGGGGGGGGGGGDGRPKPATRTPAKPASPNGEEPVATAARTRSTTPKRKRKRRK